MLIASLQREWAEARKELQEERDNVRALTLDRERTIKNAMRQVEEMQKDLANAWSTVRTAETRAAVAEVSSTPPLFFVFCFCFTFYVI